MAALYGAGAASNEKEEWSGIHWQAAHLQVRRLQARIVKATKESRWGKVKALQHLLTHSFYGRVLAVKRVTENKGKNTPGVDQVVWRAPRQKMLGVRSLKRRGYRPQPLRRIYIPKKNGRKRPLGIPTMKDRAMQALYLLALEPVAECLADPHSYGFRPERSTADAMRHCHTVLALKRAAQWILEGDIKSCFDRIGHDWLLRHIPIDREVLRKWLRAGYMEKHVFHHTEEGTPQGGVISPVLANLALDGLQSLLRKHFPRQTLRGCDKVNLVRYASEEKTRITHIKDGFDFLGQTVRKYNNGKCIIKPARENVLAFLEKIRVVIKGNLHTPAGQLVVMLNPLIRGWANYHRHQCSKKTFESVDYSIYRWLWRWAKRRHPTKGSRWVKEKYFGTKGGDHWRFFGEIKQTDLDSGNVRPKRVYLRLAASTPIRRHTAIRAQANPYDPEWETYFEEREGLKMAGDLKGRRRLSYLWKQQGGVCPVCSQRITRLSGWHLHHKVWRTLGGSDGSGNQVLLHPHCHEKAHAPLFSVKSPGPLKGLGEA